MALELTRNEEQEQIRQAARVFYESNPSATLASTAKAYSVTTRTTERWSSEDGWRKANKLPAAGLPRRQLALVKSATREKGELLDGYEVEAIGRIEFHRERNRVASRLSRNMQMLQNQIMAEGVSKDTSPAAMDRLKKLALAADAQKKLGSELRQLWRLDDGIAPTIDDNITEEYIAIAEARIRRELALNSAPADIPDLPSSKVSFESRDASST
ncbi:hypothetical protein NMD10_27730 (plasmid) [Citrobacter portucalensis]|uniref:hypothetical protein n=1 Tax=Citrobacter portucalensis TaxID=1639133 RepID=UPI00351D2B85